MHVPVEQSLVKTNCLPRKLDFVFFSLEKKIEYNTVQKKNKTYVHASPTNWWISRNEEPTGTLLMPRAKLLLMRVLHRENWSSFSCVVIVVVVVGFMDGCENAGENDDIVVGVAVVKDRTSDLWSDGRIATERCWMWYDDASKGFVVWNADADDDDNDDRDGEDVGCKGGDCCFCGDGADRKDDAGWFEPPKKGIFLLLLVVVVDDKHKKDERPTGRGGGGTRWPNGFVVDVVAAGVAGGGVDDDDDKDMFFSAMENVVREFPKF
jgi:hypothetical protein